MIANTFQVYVGSSWVTLPPPTEWEWSYYDLSSDDSGRDLAGGMHKDVVAVKRKNELTWINRDSSIAKTIMTAAKASIFVQFRYFDLYTGAQRTATVYTGDITASAHNASGQTVFEVKLSFIEK